MNDLYTGKYKKFMIIPILVLIPVLFFAFVSPGLKLGIELTGGNVLIVRADKELDSATVEDLLKSEFNLPQVNVSTINSPNSMGAYIEYSKDPKFIQAEELINLAQIAVDEEKDSEAIGFSTQAIKLLSGRDETFTNPKVALITAQDELLSANENFSEQMKTSLINKFNLGENTEFQLREVSPTLGKASLESGGLIGLVALILITLVIFVSFRQLIPTVGIVQAMIFDVLVALAGMALFNIPVSLITLSALLMIVGYSVDSDIMLTSRMLKDKTGAAGEKATNSLKTGLTMAGTTIVALISMIIISYLYQIDVILQISLVLFFGLLGDLISTWITNVGVLMWFVEGRKK
ncbi:MAG TPA: hypothetical protein PKK60_00360 [archaeon]|nr:hypothetical protein [archaeon]